MRNLLDSIAVGTNFKLGMATIIASSIFRFFQICIKLYFRDYSVNYETIFNCRRAREIAKADFVHDRKFALFTG
jgi:hypothetical protein